ncbi:hypothetical protein M3Y97_00068800 [Aphelenchoides bicaudatus]|nr:hypothetical protein M3Y97_00068800 [Aphelenchoides bicaudatus]
MRPLLFLLLTSTVCEARIFYTDQLQEQSTPVSLNSDRIKVFQERILTILGLQRPDPTQTQRNSDEFASRFMSALFELMDDNEDRELAGKIDNEIGRVLDDVYKESKLADTIVSFVPEIRESDESFSSMYKATFSASNSNDGQLIAARLFVVLENAVLNKSTSIRIFRKTISSELTEIGHQNLSSYGELALVSLNVTQLLSHWILNQQPAPTQQTIYLELNELNGTSIEIKKIKNLHCFGVGLFLDRPREVEKRVRRSLNVELHEDEESSTVSATNTSFYDNSTTPLRRLDKLSNSNDTRCGLRSLYVDFRDLGWSDWIIAPQGYYADFCSGSCGFPLDNNVLPINHAIVQTLVHILDKRRAPSPKCAPADLSDQSILFLNNEKNLVMKKYHNMRVTQCGCR